MSRHPTLHVREFLRSVRSSRALPVAVFLVVSAVGAGMAFVAFRAEQEAGKTHFQLVADEAVDRVRERVAKQTAYLKAILSFLSADRSERTSGAFHSYVSSLGVTNRLNTVGYARFIKKGEEDAVESALARNYGVARRVWPATSNSSRAPVVLIEPFNVSNANMLGYDVLSEAERGRAVRAAMESGESRASGPVQLAGETETAYGFVIFMPFLDAGDPGLVTGGSGVVYAAIAATDMFDKAIQTMPRLPLVIDVADISSGKAVPLYTSPDFGAPGGVPPGVYVVERTIEVAGRTWRMTIRSIPDLIKPESHAGSLTLGLIALVLAGVLAAATGAQIRATKAAQDLNAFHERATADKDLMLQEMKHRIKNSITRIMAMARQTAAGADSVDAFIASFSARLQAMANSQDLLTRSRWQTADLKEHLETELRQVFGEHLDEKQMSGPPVQLNETMTQALGLTFHELATNSMKYGALSEAGGELKVQWRLEGEGRGKTLALDWIETCKPVAPPEREGLGSRLISANIEGTLQGSIERIYGDDGLVVHIRIPMPVDGALPRAAG